MKINRTLVCSLCNLFNRASLLLTTRNHTMLRMKFKLVIAILLLLVSFSAVCQVNKKPAKYPSLFWEITKKGEAKPSYLFGTMHVSSKLVYNLPDSFYLGIKNVQVVALENDMAYWQQDMDKYDMIR